MDGGRLLFKNFIAFPSQQEVACVRSAEKAPPPTHCHNQNISRMYVYIRNKLREKIKEPILRQKANERRTKRWRKIDCGRWSEKKWDCREIKQLSRNLAGGLTRAQKGARREKNLSCECSACVFIMGCYCRRELGLGRSACFLYGKAHNYHLPFPMIQRVY